MSKRASGVTLIELLVALGLLSLILTLLVQLLLPGFSLWKQARGLADLEQQCMVAEERIARSVLASISGSIQSASDTQRYAISMLGHGGTEAVAGYDTTTGDPLWKQVEIFTVSRDNGILYHTFWNDSGGLGHTYAFGSEPFQLTPEELLTIASASGQQERRLADRVFELSLTPAALESPTTPPVDSEGYILRLALRAEVAGKERVVARQLYLVPRLRER